MNESLSTALGGMKSDHKLYSTFDVIMSNHGQKLLIFMLEWARVESHQYPGGWTQFVEDFAQQFKPFNYDAVAHKYQLTDFFPSTKRNGEKPVPKINKKMAKRDILERMTLSHFKDCNWRQSEHIKDRPGRVGQFENYGVDVVYNLVMTGFAKTNLDLHELDKIVFLVDGIDNPEKLEIRKNLISKEMKLLLDDGKPVISFLAANVERAESSTIALRDKYRKQNEASDAVLARMYKLAGDTTHKVKHAFNAQDYEAIEAQRREANKTDTDRLYETLWSQAEARLNVAPTMPPWFASPEEWLKDQCLNGVTDYNRPVPPLNTVMNKTPAVNTVPKNRVAYKSIDYKTISKDRLEKTMQADLDALNKYYESLKE